MHKVVNGERGTARGARLPNPEITMAGKTGTSQVRRISRTERLSGVRKNEEKAWEERDHGLFVAFAPYRAPRYAVAVVVEHGGSGSQSAAPIARDIMAKALELDPARTKPAISLEWPRRPARWAGLSHDLGCGLQAGRAVPAREAAAAELALRAGGRPGGDGRLRHAVFGRRRIACAVGMAAWRPVSEWAWAFSWRWR